MTRFLTYFGEFVFQKTPANIKANKGKEGQGERRARGNDCSYEFY